MRQTTGVTFPHSHGSSHHPDSILQENDEIAPPAQGLAPEPEILPDVWPGDTPSPFRRLAPALGLGTLAFPAPAWAAPTNTASPITLDATSLVAQAMLENIPWYLGANALVLGWMAFHLSGFKIDIPAGLWKKTPVPSEKEIYQQAALFALGPLLLSGIAYGFLNEMETVDTRLLLLWSAIIVLHFATSAAYMYKRVQGYEVAIPDYNFSGQNPDLSTLKKLSRTLLATSALFAGATAISYGDELARASTNRAYQKLAVQVLVGDVRDGQVSYDTIGYIYGNKAGVDPALLGNDQAIAVGEDALQMAGDPLYHWYKALIYLEDRGHEDGLSEITGINPRLAKALVSLGHAGGGSSIADQACGAMQSGFPDYAAMSRWQRKIDDTLCGVGLARNYSPQYIASLYATFGFMGKGNTMGVDAFARKFWGMENGVYDERMTIGHELVLAALVNRPWQGDNWQLIRERAGWALEGLISAGIIDAASREEIAAQIVAARPFASAKKIRSITTKEGYDYPIFLAARQAEETYGSQWRTQVRKLYLTVDPNVQGRTLTTGKSTLVEINDPRARFSALIIDEHGRIIAAVTGKMDGASFVHDGRDRLSENKQAGSLGKILLAMAADYTAPDRDSREFATFTDDMRWSRPHIMDSAHTLAINPDIVQSYLEFYGVDSKYHDDPIRTAATGSFDITMMSGIRMLLNVIRDPHYDAKPHIVSFFQLNDGKIVPVRRIKNGPDPLYQTNGPRQQKIMAAPLTGTLQDMHAALINPQQYDIIIGKTGTVGRSDADENNSVWTLVSFGNKKSRDVFSAMLNVSADDRSQTIDGLGVAGRALSIPTARIINGVSERRTAIELISEGK